MPLQIDGYSLPHCLVSSCSVSMIIFKLKSESQGVRLAQGIRYELYFSSLDWT
jgi:hypothetical protein